MLKKHFKKLSTFIIFAFLFAITSYSNGVEAAFTCQAVQGQLVCMHFNAPECAWPYLTISPLTITLNLTNIGLGAYIGNSTYTTHTGAFTFSHNIPSSPFSCNIRNENCTQTISQGRLFGQSGTQYSMANVPDGTIITVGAHVHGQLHQPGMTPITIPFDLGYESEGCRWQVPQLACGDNDTNGKCGAEGGCTDPARPLCSNGQCVIDVGICGGTWTPPTPPPSTCNPELQVCGTTHPPCCDGLQCVSSGGEFRCQAVTGETWCQIDGDCTDSCAAGGGGTCNTATNTCTCNPPPGGDPVDWEWKIPDAEYIGPLVDFRSLLRTIHGILLPVGIGLIAVPLIIINGYKIMTSQGDPARVNAGKEGLTSAIIGTLFILLSLWIVRMVISNFLQ